MATLQFKRVTKDVEYLPFDCGVDSINEYVKNSYYPTIMQQAYAYCIMSNHIILGYYQILFRELELDDFPDEISEYNADIKEDKISSVHIRYLAIEKKYQSNKIGTNTLQVIIKDIEQFAENWPIRVIAIDARNDLVEWYEKQGFKRMRKNTVGQDISTEAMYFDCMRFSDELETYLESQYE